MIDIQHDSPVPIHEQIITQLMTHVAEGALPPGARLREFRAFAQELLTHPQVVSRAYADLERDGIARQDREGGAWITEDAADICRARLRERGRRDLRQAVARALAAGLSGADVLEVVDREIAAAKARSHNPPDAIQALSKPDERRHRAATGIQDLSRQKGPGPVDPDRPPGGDFRLARG